MRIHRPQRKPDWYRCSSQTRVRVALLGELRPYQNPKKKSNPCKPQTHSRNIYNRPSHLSLQKSHIITEQHTKTLGTSPTRESVQVTSIVPKGLQMPAEYRPQHQLPGHIRGEANPDTAEEMNPMPPRKSISLFEWMRAPTRCLLRLGAPQKPLPDG